MKYEAMLEDAGTFSFPCFLAVSELLGESWIDWEPETVWLTLHRNHGVDVPAQNRDQILACRNLLTTGRFWHDALVFIKTCQAFNNEEPDYVVMDADVPVPFMNWAVYEATQVIDDHEFGNEVEVVTANILYEDGFLKAPMYLSYAQDHLNDFYPSESKKMLAKLEIEQAANKRSSDDTLAHQQDLLEGTAKYFEKRKLAFKKQMAVFAD